MEEQRKTNQPTNNQKTPSPTKQKYKKQIKSTNLPPKKLQQGLKLIVITFKFSIEKKVHSHAEIALFLFPYEFSYQGE